MEFSDLLSIIALTIAATTFILSYLQNRKNRIESLLYQEAMYHLQRYTQLEHKLADWPDVLKFYNIDIEKANNEGVSKEQIAYLVISINAIVWLSMTRKKSIYDELEKNELRQRMFENIETRRTWKYAKNCFGIWTSEQIDKYLSENFPNDVK